MNERDLGKSLLRGEAAPDVHQLTEHVLRRDRRRVWLLAAACVVTWMLVVMLPWSTVLPMLAKVVEQVGATNGAAPATADAARQREQWTALLQIVKQGTIATFLGSLASMLMAAVCTVALIVASRRATLRQVNARLAEISDQLKALAAKQG
jgi:ABC-type Fe3+ transport system permease subunit